MTAGLSLPTVTVRESFLEAVDEFRAEGRGGVEDRSMLGREVAAWSGRFETEEGFAGFVADLRAQALEETPRPAHFVPSTTYWWVEGPEYIGRIALRHRLNERLLAVGGHIGYDVRPSARRRGHATAMLAAALVVAHSRGIESALVTCDAGNVASRKVIEHNGGVLEDEREGVLRYWVPTSAAGASGSTVS